MTIERFKNRRDEFVAELNYLLRNHHSQESANYYMHVASTLNAEQLRLLCTVLDDTMLDPYWSNPVCVRKANEYNTEPSLVNFNEGKGVTTAKWKDGTITQVRCKEDDIWDPEKALAMVFMKKWCCGNDASKFHKLFKEYLPDDPLAKAMTMPEFINALLHLTGKDSTEPATDESDEK